VTKIVGPELAEIGAEQVVSWFVEANLILLGISEVDFVEHEGLIQIRAYLSLTCSSSLAKSRIVRR